MEILTPRSCRSVRICMARTESTMRALSVISTVSAAGVRSQVVRSSVIMPTRCRSSSDRTERFTAVLTSRPAPCQSWQARSAASRTQRVSGLIRPVCSARGMKWSGGMKPCWGCCQRTSASYLRGVTGGEVHFGLEMQEELIVLDGPAQLRHQRQPARTVLVLAGRVERVAAAGALGTIHSDVCPPQECRNILAMLRIDGDADA